MKVIASSPYATFKAKEWNSLTKRSHSLNPSCPIKLKKKYFKNICQLESEETNSQVLHEPKMIQLAFA